MISRGLRSGVSRTDWSRVLAKIRLGSLGKSLFIKTSSTSFRNIFPRKLPVVLERCRPAVSRAAIVPPPPSPDTMYK